MLETQLSLIGISVFFALSAGTLASAVRNLRRRPAESSRPVVTWFLAATVNVLWLCVVISLISVAIHPITMLGGVLLIVAIAFYTRMQIREERRSLDRWVRMTHDRNASLTPMLAGFASACHTGVGERAKQWIRYLTVGMPLGNSVKLARIDLSSDTVTRLTEDRISAHNEETAINDDATWRADADRALALMWERFLYAYLLVILAWLISKAIGLTAGGAIDELYDEFTIYERDSSFLQQMYDLASWLSTMVAGLFTLWLVAAILVPWLPPWLQRCVPWFGTAWANRQRCESLSALSRGMVRGHAPDTIIDASSRYSRNGWVKKRAANAIRRIGSGEPLTAALRRSGWIAAREEAWLASAQANHNLPLALGHLAGDVSRRETRRMSLQMAWFVPTVIVLVGWFVFLIFWHAMTFLTSAISFGT